MSFEIDHDWEGNLATPKARIGEKVKIRLLVLLCAIWILLGLFSHHPWKPEAESLSIIQGILQQGHWLVLSAHSDELATHPPLYYWLAAAFGKLFSGLFSLHDAARLSNAVWMSLTLLLVGMTGRELWGSGVGRQTTFILISSIGLISGAHLLNPYVAGLTGLAMGFYALTLAHRRPYRAALLLGAGMAITFLSVGLLHSLILFTCTLLLPLIFSNWRNHTYFACASLGLLIAAIPIIAWWLTLDYIDANVVSAWWQHEIKLNRPIQLAYFFRTLSWFSWPALPVAIWGLWVYRQQLLVKPKLQLMLSFFVISLLLLSLAGDTSESSAYALLLPLVALAAGSVERLKRGAAGALNWFGLILFGLIGILIWLGWFALSYGWPEKLYQRMQFLSGVSDYPLSLTALIVALLISFIWLVTVHAKRSNRAAVTDWAVGITMAWTLLMSLWLPLLDSAKSYASVASSLQQKLPKQYDCLQSINLTSQQENLFGYYLNRALQPSEWYQQQSCQLLLVRFANRYQDITPDKKYWKAIWRDKRPADRHERFVLYQLKPQDAAP